MNNSHQNSNRHTTVQIPNYKIVETVYSGSRTLVYRAIRTHDQLPVAIKLLKNDYPSFSELVQFRNQYTIAKNLCQLGIIQTYSLEAYKNGYALVMEDFGGISLKEWGVGNSPWGVGVSVESLREFLDIAIALCNTLDILYRERVIHKDIKPANILINPETKEIKLIDFSIASLLPRETQEIQNANSLEGTLAYLSPEQTGRMNRGIDYRSDFYCLGVTFYELLTGQLPFQSNDPMELVHCHLAKTPISAHQIDPQIPLVLSEIISKLMAKNAEDRYQSALGIRHDLAICRQQLEATGNIESFAIGERDLCDRFTIPEKLYGREAEVQALLNAFDRIAGGAPQPPLKRGALAENSPLNKKALEENSPLLKGGGGGAPLSGSELMLVAGFSGIGKTAVINEVHKPIARQRGYFIKGKYDQFQRNIPFSAFVQAFRDLMGQLLSESDAQVNNWKSKILEVVGDNGQVLVDVIPELELIIGKQPTATELSGTAAQNRFNLLIQKFVKIFTGQAHPLVIFIDDLQWADSASLNLLKLLMQDTKYLLILGAYRNNEVSPAHPFILTIDEISKTGAVVNTITLQPLSLLDTNYLVADTLTCDLSLAQPLTELIYQKTIGNPFFATQFLKALYEDKQIVFTPPTPPSGGMGGWQCDIAKIQALAITDDVVEFMALQLQRLPRETQNALKLAACIGSEFDLNTLAIISEQSMLMMAAVLWRALQEGFVIPITKTYKFFTESDNNEEVFSGSANPTYRFLHDRVQQAAYSLIPDDQKQKTHYQIGQVILQQISPEAREERIFEIVNQLNYGTDLITQQTVRDELAQLNLIAGKKAIASTAYAAAVKYLCLGIELLNANSWVHQYNLTLALYSAAVEASFLNANFAQMETFASQVLQQAKTLFDAVKIYEVQIQASIVQNRSEAGLLLGLEVLEKLNVRLPKQVNIPRIVLSLGATKLALAGKPMTSLATLPEMTARDMQAAIPILVNSQSAAYLSKPDFLPLLVFKALRLSVRYGNHRLSCFIYAWYGLILCGVTGEIQAGYEFGQLAIALLNRFNAKEIEAKTRLTIYAFINHWKYHARNDLPLFLEAYQVGLETGDMGAAAWIIYSYCCTAYLVGDRLSELEEKCQIYGKAMAEFGQDSALIYHQEIHQVILNLLGHGEHPAILQGKVYNESEVLPKLIAAGDKTGVASTYIHMMMLGFWFGDLDRASSCLEKAYPYLEGIAGSFLVTNFYLYSSLIQLEQYPKASINKQKHILKQVAENQKKFRNWKNYCPANIEHKFYLVEAEKSRVLYQNNLAIEYYDCAISGAKANEYIQEEALANELAAKFYLDWGKEKLTQVYMIEAYYCYSGWGAKAKVTDLEQRYPQFLQSILQQPKTSFNALETLTSITHSSTKVSSTSISDSLDFASVIQAAQALSSTIELDKLLKQLTQIILQNSGGSKCILVLPDRETWHVRAISTPETTELCSIPLDDCSDVPLKLIQYVKRTQSVVAIDNLQTNLPVIDDYLILSNPKSVLCLPILDRGHLAGILYLKNEMTAGVFTSDRLTIINFLCTQAAISLENARLYQVSQQALAELQIAEVALQKKEQFLRSIYDGAELIIVVIDVLEDGSFCYAGCNLAAEKNSGVPSIDCVGKTLIEFHGEQEGALLEKQFTECVQGGVPISTENLLTLNGEKKWFLATHNPLKNKKGRVYRIITTTIDISDRKLAEEQLRDSEARFRSIIENAQDIIFMLNPEGNFSYLSPSWRDTLGYNPNETINQPFAPFVHPDDLHLYMDVFIRLLHGADKIATPEYRALHRDGTYRWLISYISSIKDADGRMLYACGVTRDNTDRKQAEVIITQKSQELELALRDLQQSQLQMIQTEKMSALGSLVAGVAHEINNPVGFLGGNIQPALDYINDLFGLIDLVQQKYPQLDPEIQSEIETIELDYIREDLPKLVGSMREGVKRIQDISTSLRTFSRADTDHPVACNIHDGIDSTLMILKHRLKANESRPEIEVIKDYGNLPKIECYAGQLNQVFMNILGNASDALDDSNTGRTFAEIQKNPNQITITTSVENNRVKIAIADNGKGMSLEVKQKVFDHLFTTKGVGKGTGLGLAIARQIVVEKHGGTIKVNSELGQGTEFAIALPINSNNNSHE